MSTCVGIAGGSMAMSSPSLTRAPTTERSRARRYSASLFWTSADADLPGSPCRGRRLKIGGYKCLSWKRHHQRSRHLLFFANTNLTSVVGLKASTAAQKRRASPRARRVLNSTRVITTASLNGRGLLNKTPVARGGHVGFLSLPSTTI